MKIICLKTSQKYWFYRSKHIKIILLYNISQNSITKIYFNGPFHFYQYSQKSMTSIQLKANNEITQTVLEQIPKKLKPPTQVIEKQPTQPIRLKSQPKLITIGLIVSIGAFIYGYGLKEITSVTIEQLVEEYHIQITSSTALSILIGIMPLGCFVGSIVTKFLLQRFRRLTPIKFFAMINIGAIVLVNINNFTTLVIGRFIKGVCIGYYSSITPIYLREIAPKQLRRLLGLFFAFSRVIGVLFVIALQLIFKQNTFALSYRIILSLTAVFSTIMAILILLFCPDTPTDLIQIGDDESAKKVITQLYKQQYVQQVFNEYKKEVEMERAKTMDRQIEMVEMKRQQKPAKQASQGITKHIPKIQGQDILSNIQKQKEKEQEKEREKETKMEERRQQIKRKTKSAFLVGVHLCFIRHGTGGVIMLTQGGLFINAFNKNLGQYTSLIINLVQLLFIIIGIVFIQKYVGKRPLFIFSIATMSLINLGLSVAMIHLHVLSSITLMIIFMMVYGSSFVSPVWSYPSQVIPASNALIPNSVNWIGLTVTTLIPPLISGAMPNNNPYPVFIFLGVYGFLALIHIYRDLRESDGKTYNQIIESYK